MFILQKKSQKTNFLSIRTAPVDIYHGIEELEKENELSIRTAPVDIYRNHINNLYHGR